MNALPRAIPRRLQVLLKSVNKLITDCWDELRGRPLQLVPDNAYVVGVIRDLISHRVTCLKVLQNMTEEQGLNRLEWLN
jgi:hypothetical protein